MSNPWRFRGGNTASIGSITALEFDPDVELLWLCDSYGQMTSFTLHTQGETPVWSPYSSFSASTRHASNVWFIRYGQSEKMVTIADRDCIRGFKRGGIPVVCLPIPAQTQNYIDLFQADAATGAMYFTGNAGLTRVVLHDDDDTEVNTVSLEDNSATTVMRQGGEWVATGTSTGQVTIWNAKTLSQLGHISLSRNRVSAIDVFGNNIAVASPDRATTSVVRLYDVRKLNESVTTVTDIPSSNVVQLRRYQDSFGREQDRAFVLTSQNFSIVQFDQEKSIYTSAAMSEGNYTTVAVSPSNMCAVVGNDKGTFFMYAHPASTDKYVMSTFADPVRPAPRNFSKWKESHVDADFDGSCPPSTLASNWPEDNYMILSAPQRLRCVNLEPNVLHRNDWGLTRADSYLTDPKDKVARLIPNPYPFNTGVGDDPSKVLECLEEMRKDMKRRHKTTRGTGGDYAPMENAAQACYSLQHRIDWRSYNEIPQKVVGIDNSFPECWFTPIIQSLYLCKPPEYPIRKVILRHLCIREFCVACELNFIFSNMLMTANSALGMKEMSLPPIVQVGSLIRTMRQLRAFRPVFEPPKSRDEAVARMHLCVRILLETLHKDLQDQKAYPFPGHPMPSADYSESIAQFFGTEFSSSNGCVHIEPRFLWEVPVSALRVHEGLQHILKQLEKYKEEVAIKRLPPIIVLLLNSEHNNLKPSTILKITRSEQEDFSYVLNTNIIHLAEDLDDTGNFVGHERITSDCYSLVNDYRVSAPVKLEDLERGIPAMVSHSPVVTFYALDSLQAPPYARGEEPRPPNMWTTLGPLFINDVLARPSPRGVTPFKTALKTYDEVRPGNLIAIDAEYVVLKWRARSDEDDALMGGIYNPHRKPHMGLARVSCILSSADGDERTIVDDYVHVPEEIEDYVTQYSGIHPGDLDPSESSKQLTSLKATYLKLRALVDCGITFVGHGLGQDFRVCNIVVPKKQIIDTLEIFHKPGARYLSLRFLAYHVLHENVQEDEHDSIEDARTSLRLYRKYMQLKAEGVFEKVLDNLMHRGAETSWYVPDSRAAAFNDAPVTPPASVMGSPVFKEEAQADGGAFDGAESPVGSPTDGEAEKHIASVAAS